jgi:uncharacterized protein YqeY
MSLEITINNDIKDAMRSKNAKKLEALRAIKASLLLAKTGKDMSSGEIPEEVEISLLKRLVKQRKESAAIFNDNGKEEMAKEELYQAGIIEKYLPEQMGEEEIEVIVDAAINELGASSMKDMGKIMSVVTKQLAGKADNKLVSEIVKKLLN